MKKLWTRKTTKMKPILPIYHLNILQGKWSAVQVLILVLISLRDSFFGNLIEDHIIWEQEGKPWELWFSDIWQGSEYVSGHYTDSIATPGFLECHLDSKYRPYCHFCKSCFNARLQLNCFLYIRLFIRIVFIKNQKR